MIKKPHFSPEEHCVVGQYLKKVVDRLGSLEVEIGNAFPIDSRCFRLAVKAKAAVEALQCELDDVMAKDHPKDFSPSVYYGSTEGAA